MNKYHAEQMVQDGMHFGIHGYNHCWWDKLDQKELNSEIRKSAAFLEEIGAGKDCLTACYPYGAYNKDIINALKDFNCKLAFTTEVGIAELKAENAMILPRLDTNDIPKAGNSVPNEWHKKA